MKKLFSEDDKIAYYASDDGKIFSLRKKSGKWRELKPWKGRDGYTLFKCCQNGVKKSIRVHRAIWEAFNGPIPHGLQINHRNCKRDDNRLEENLELVTPSGNQLYPPTRENHREAMRSKMKPVLDVTTGVVYESTKLAARQTGLNHGNISACCNGKRNQTGSHQFRYTDTLSEDELVCVPEYVETQVSNYIDFIAHELSGK